jgi:putative toxin-antitoxin system antitoxin component (TIGR02293 family)
MSVLPNKRRSISGIDVPPDAKPILKHALETFGSEEKALHWLQRPNHLLGGSTPIDILQIEPARYELVEDELTRIDHGVFV